MSRKWLCECGRTLATIQEKEAGLCYACQYPETDLTGCDKLADEQLTESAAMQRDIDNGRAEVSG